LVHPRKEDAPPVFPDEIVGGTFKKMRRVTGNFEDYAFRVKLEEHDLELLPGFLEHEDLL
jgi:hypothetical protein